MMHFPGTLSYLSLIVPGLCSAIRNKDFPNRDRCKELTQNVSSIKNNLFNFAFVVTKFIIVTKL